MPSPTEPTNEAAPEPAHVTQGRAQEEAVAQTALLVHFQNRAVLLAGELILAQRRVTDLEAELVQANQKDPEGTCPDCGYANGSEPHIKACETAAPDAWDSAPADQGDETG